MSTENNTTTAFLDILFCINLVIFVLLLLAVQMVNPKAKKADVELKAEYLITLSWDETAKDDIDIFVKPPQGNVVFYGAKDGKLISLGRDDLGHNRDTITLPNGEEITVEDNWEHVTIRKAIPGQYSVNLFLYKQRSDSVEATVKLEQLNPYKVVYTRKITLEEANQEETALNFTIEDGKVTAIDTLFTPVVQERY